MKSEMQIQERIQQMQDRLESNKDDEVFMIQCTAWIEGLEWVLR